MATISNNTKKAHNLFFHVQLLPNASATANLDHVTEWITQTVGTLFPVDEGQSESTYPCSVVSGVLCNEHLDAEDDGGDGEMHNEILAVAHRTWGKPEHDILANSVKANLIVVNEQHIDPRDTKLLDPQKVAEAWSGGSKSTVPTCVTGVGISGVSWQYAKEIWAEIISTDRAFMEDSGEGYMEHPMMLYDADNGFTSMREMSFNFGWDMHLKFA